MFRSTCRLSSGAGAGLSRRSKQKSVDFDARADDDAPLVPRTLRKANVQHWNAEAYAHHARFVADLARPLIGLLDPKPSETILDLGCGNGVLSLEIQRRGAKVIGVDQAPAMVEAARKLGIDARLVDGQALDLPERFDAVFSNAALHWMPNAAAVVQGVHRHLKAGGRFVGEMGGHGNVAAVATAILAVLGRHGIDGAALYPWFFPTTEEYAALLESHGFIVTDIRLIPRPTPLPTGIEGWLATFVGPFVSAVDRDKRGQIVAEIRNLLKWSLCDRQGRWTADYVRLRFAARRR
jgi:trans-aconitate methyltransferase